MKAITYFNLKSFVIQYGYTNELIDIKKCLNEPQVDLKTFFLEYVWVVVNSGMKNQIADKIYQKILKAIYTNNSIGSVFGHKLKTAAIEFVYNNLDSIFHNFILSEDKIEYLDTLPFIGSATKYHLARNLGFDVCKPDRHLVRISTKYKCNPHEFCKKISEVTGDKIGLVDLVVWRAANLGFI